MTNINLPAWLEWLGSPIVCTIVSAVAVAATIYSLVLKSQNSELRLQTQTQTGQGGPQQQGAQGQAMQVTGSGGNVTPMQVTGSGNNVTINNNYYNTESEN
jgi:hypothetical protein